jgi:hypothetical protein
MRVPIRGINTIFHDEPGGRLRDALKIRMRRGQEAVWRHDALANRRRLVPGVKSGGVHGAAVRRHREGARRVGKESDDVERRSGE